jgi:hypothetical protein
MAKERGRGLVGQASMVLAAPHEGNVPGRREIKANPAETGPPGQVSVPPQVTPGAGCFPEPPRHYPGITLSDAGALG